MPLAIEASKDAGIGAGGRHLAAVLAVVGGGDVIEDRRGACRQGLPRNENATDAANGHGLDGSRCQYLPPRGSSRRPRPSWEEEGQPDGHDAHDCEASHSPPPFRRGRSVAPTSSRRAWPVKWAGSTDHRASDRDRPMRRRPMVPWRRSGEASACACAASRVIGRLTDIGAQGVGLIGREQSGQVEMMNPPGGTDTAAAAACSRHHACQSRSRLATGSPDSTTTTRPGPALVFLSTVGLPLGSSPSWSCLSCRRGLARRGARAAESDSLLMS